MQGLVYIFIALSALGIGGAAYFGLTFSPIEATVTAIAFGCVAVMLVERALRQRSEARLEKAIEDLSRLLSTDAQAGSMLSQRVNALADANAGARLTSVEADLSVLGTVIRQVADVVADLEEQRREAAPPGSRDVPPDPDTFPEPVIPVEMLRQAISENRLICHIEPIVTLPQRNAYAYDLVPRLMLEDGDLADRPDFMPRRGGEDVIRRIEAICLEEAIVIARRARTGGSPIILYVPLSRHSLTDARTVEKILSSLDANRAIAGALRFLVPYEDWKTLGAKDKAQLSVISKIGVGLSLGAATSLRFDYAELQGVGFETVRIDASRFLRQPESFTDFHTADIAAYGRRFEIELVATGVIDDQQLLSLYEDSITLAQGPVIAGPGPVRPDLLAEREPATATARRAEL